MLDRSSDLSALQNTTTLSRVTRDASYLLLDEKQEMETIEKVKKRMMRR